MRPRLLLGLVLALPACGPKAGETATVPAERPVASAGIVDPDLARLLEDAWDAALADAPETATQLGLPGHDAEVTDPSPAASARRAEARRALLGRARALSARSLGPTDRRWLDLFVDQLETDTGLEACRFERWSLSATSNAMADLWATLDLQPLGDESAADAFLARLRAWADASPARLAALRAGRDEGLVASATSVERVLEQVETELGQPVERWAPARREPPEGAPWGAAFAARRDALLDGPVRAALAAWRDVLRSELLPVARDDDAPGLASLPVGPDCYAASIRAYTTLPLTADELHATGLAELARIDAELRRLGPGVLGTGDVPTILARLREDPALAFRDADAIVARAEAILARTAPVLPAWFGHLPATSVEVRVIPDHEAPYTYSAYYRQPSADGRKPGEYFVNTFRPETRRAYEAEALAFHESIPGHHLQLALAYEQPDAPAFHRFAYRPAFVEGWALYAEGLADEMGLYDGDLDRLGMLAFDAWRAARLVVDTGLHDEGWSRQQAIDFLLEHTALAPDNVVNEVDRYVTWPGQALAYKTGQLEILRLRREAESALGDAFDVRAFHDAVLGGGSVTLPILRRQVDAFVGRHRSSPRAPSP